MGLLQHCDGPACKGTAVGLPVCRGPDAPTNFPSSQYLGRTVDALPAKDGATGGDDLPAGGRQPAHYQDPPPPPQGLHPLLPPVKEEEGAQPAAQEARGAAVPAAVAADGQAAGAGGSGGSAYLGVSWCQQRGGWVAELWGSSGQARWGLKKTRNRQSVAHRCCWG